MLLCKILSVIAISVVLVLAIPTWIEATKEILAGEHYFKNLLDQFSKNED